jgi:galactose mutarotase-like enzyme
MTFSAREIELRFGARAVVLENEHLSVLVLVEKGADILSIKHKSNGFDPMWVSPWGVRSPHALATAPDSQIAWMESYAGGWQELFPNGGAACIHHGAALPFHGEASVLPWEWEVLPDGIRFYVRLVRSPFTLERTMRLSPDAPVLTVEGRATNHGRVSIEYMWSHHPAFGAPFLSGESRIESNALKLIADPYGPGPLLEAGSEHVWPTLIEHEGRSIDLTRIPGEEENRSLMAYLVDFPEETAWYAIVNDEAGTSIRFEWNRDDFPCAWLWQEMHFHQDAPWYGECYVMAIEPATSYPGGLANVLATTKTHRILEPGQTATNALEIALTAV